MAKNIYNENYYLSGNQDALDVFYEISNRYQIKHAIERMRYDEAIKLYNKFLMSVRNLLNSLKLNSSLEYSIAIAYLINKGYLSTDKQFKAEEIKEVLSTRWGLSIVKGYGCCRNYSDINRDLLNLLYFYAKNLYCFLPKLSLPITSKSKKANHIINLVEFEGNKYGIDIYNKCALFYFKNPFILERITLGDTIRIRNKPYGEIMFGENDLKGIKKELEEFELESKKNPVSPLCYEELYEDTISFMNAHKDMFEDFHNETKDIKDNIVLKLSKGN